MNTTRYGTRRCVLSSLFVVLVALGLLPEAIEAAPTYSASIPGVETVNASPTPVFLSNRTERVDRDTANNVIGQATHQETAGASYGQLRGSNNADYLNVHPHFPFLAVGGRVGNNSHLSLSTISSSPAPQATS